MKKVLMTGGRAREPFSRRVDRLFIISNFDTKLEDYS